MDKKILMGIAGFYLALNVTFAAQYSKTNAGIIAIKNDSVAEIKVRLKAKVGGVNVITVTDVSSGQYANLPAPDGGTPFNLIVKYKNSIKGWVKIPGCPEGNFFGGLSINVFGTLPYGVPTCSLVYAHIDEGQSS